MVTFTNNVRSVNFKSLCKWAISVCAEGADDGHFNLKMFQILRKILLSRYLLSQIEPSVFGLINELICSSDKFWFHSFFTMQLYQLIQSTKSVATIKKYYFQPLQVHKLRSLVSGDTRISISRARTSCVFLCDKFMAVLTHLSYRIFHKLMNFLLTFFHMRHHWRLQFQVEAIKIPIINGKNLPKFFDKSYFCKQF